MKQTYTYDGLSRLSTVSEGGAVAATYTYDLNGNRESLTYNKTGVSAAYTYNAANLVTSLENKKGTSSLSKYTYEYYPDGNQKSKTATVGGSSPATTTYEYHQIGWLKSEIAPRLSLSYAYDDRGNRKSMKNGNAETTYTYDANNRLISETTGGATTKYTYDDNGNQLSKGSEIYQYNSRNQLTSAKIGGKMSSYSYRPDGLRNSNTVAGTTVSHVWDGQNMVAEMNSNGAVTQTYLRGIGLIASKTGGAYSYYSHNAHGDVVQLTNASGAVAKSYDYDAFGVEKNPDASDLNPFRYTGEYFDKETGTYYLRARNYNPKIGRFTREDPIRSGMNWYVYCSNNPIMFIDPLGLYDVNFIDYIRAMGGTVDEYERDGEAHARVTYGDIIKNYRLNSGIMDDEKINAIFGFESFLTDMERVAEYGIDIFQGNLYKNIPTNFSTMDAAAAMFTILYSEDAEARKAWSWYNMGYAQGQEVGAYIYRSDVTGRYVLGNSFWGSHENVLTGLAAYGSMQLWEETRQPGTIVGMVHYHPSALLPGFSQMDLWIGSKFGISIYANSIELGLIRYTPSIGTISTINPGNNGQVFR